MRCDANRDWIIESGRASCATDGQRVDCTSICRFCAALDRANTALSQLFTRNRHSPISVQRDAPPQRPTRYDAIPAYFLKSDKTNWKLLQLITLPRLTQPSTLRGTVKWVSAFGLSNNNKWRRWCGWQQPTGGVTAQVSWLGLRVGGLMELSVHSSNERCELGLWKRPWPSWQHHKNCRGIIIITITITYWCCNESPTVKITSYKWAANLMYKTLSYRRGTARCVVSVEILPIATQQCRNNLYDNSWTNRSYEVGGLRWADV